jgi:putative ABC transport system permease protein
LLAHLVQQRTHEIGIRLAVGAQRGDVLQLIISNGMQLIGIGVFLGLLGTFALSSYLSGLLFGIKPSDPITIIGVIFVLCGTGFLACYLPARSASRVDPTEALRCE